MPTNDRTTDNDRGWLTVSGGPPGGETRQTVYDNQAAVSVLTTFPAALEVGPALAWALAFSGGASGFALDDATKTVEIGLGATGLASGPGYFNRAGPVGTGFVGSEFERTITVETEFGSNITIGFHQPISGRVGVQSAVGMHITSTTGTTTVQGEGLQLESFGVASPWITVAVAGGGTSYRISASTIDPNGVTAAPTGSTTQRDTAATGEQWLNKSAGGTGTYWEEVRTGPAYSSLNGQNQATKTSLGLIGVFAKYTEFERVGAEKNATGSIAADTITVDIAGDYAISFSGDQQNSDSPSAGNVFAWVIFQNGAPTFAGARFTMVTGAKNVAVGGELTVTAAAGDVFDLRVACDTADNAFILGRDMSMTVQKM